MENLMVGFTGSRHPLGEDQLRCVRDLVTRVPMEKAVKGFVHGGCMGADTQFHELIREVWPIAPIQVYPSTLRNTWGDFDRDHTQVLVHVPKVPLQRNRVMVDQCWMLIAAPRSDTEVQRSGTWATIRYACKMGKLVLQAKTDGVVWPLTVPAKHTAAH